MRSFHDAKKLIIKQLNGILENSEMSFSQWTNFSSDQTLLNEKQIKFNCEPVANERNKSLR